MHASKHTFVSTPFTGFEQCLVICQLVHHTDGLGTQQIFATVPCTDKGTPVVDSPIFLIGSSPNERTLLPLSVQQTKLTLDMLYEVVKEDDEARNFIDMDNLQEARQSLQRLSANIRDPSLVNLTSRLFAVISPITVPNTQWGIQINISGIFLTPRFMEFVGFPASNDHVKVAFQLEDIPADKLKAIRLLDEVSIYIDSGSGSEREYTGVCTKLEIYNGLFVMKIESFAREMRQSRIGHLSSMGFSPLDLVHFVARSGGLEEQNILIEGFEPHSRVFTVTVPILNMTLTEPLGFASVMFYPAGYDLTEVSRLQAFGKDGLEVFETNTLAVVRVEASTIYDALKSGMNRIGQALDVLLHIIRADTVYKGVATDSIVGFWELNDLTPRPTMSSYVHVEEPFSGGRLVMDTLRIEQPDCLTIGTEMQNVLEQLEWYALLLRELEETGREDLQNLFNALKWLRRSWDADDPDDKIIFANIALEFVAAGEADSPVIPKEFIRRVRRAAVEKFKELFDGEYKEQYVEKLNQKLGDALTKAPLRVKVEALIERLNIPVTDADLAVIFEGRNIRNDLVHGRGAKQTMSKHKARRMVNAIGIIASHKLRSLYKEANR
jgi:hypothetical protein